MAKPIFFWDLLRRLFFGALALLIAFFFWFFALFFLILNLFISWHRLWRWAGLENLMLLRFIMRIRNLYDSYRLPTSPPDPDPGAIPWDPRYRYERSADGRFNDLDDPLMGSAGRRFGRNFPLTRLRVDKLNLLEPNPREISSKLLTRDRFKPATSLNLLAAAWIQFQVHGWFNHQRNQSEFLPDIPVEDDKWPERTMRIRRTEPDRTRPDKSDPPTFCNTETHWWDASQLYGSNRTKQEKLRENKGLGAKLRTVPIKLGDGREEVRLPLVEDKELSGIELTGFNDNWWVGLSLLHTLFALEHNTICDRLRQAYPEWDDERLFQTARLINAALMAKIHTVEWTPAILGHPAVIIGMHANWWGLLTERITKNLGRIKVLKGLQEEITGIPGSEKDHHAAPYQLTEEFVSVYRMHPLIPDDYRFYSAKSDEFLEELTFTEIQGNHTRPVMKQISIEDLFYSFGVTHPGQITLHNFPRSLQRFQRIKDGNVRGEILDLATVDIIRDRERAVPRYNDFRKLLLMPPVIFYRKLVGLPIIPWFSGLTLREREERKNWVKELKHLYPKKKGLDLMVGLFAEKCPKGFGFSDTAFRIFILMASRRLKSDRFFTDDYKAEVYSDVGMQWIEDNSFKTVLQRHYPALAASIAGVDNPFTPWERAEAPSPDPEAVRNLFSAIPILGGAVLGGIIGLIGSMPSLVGQKLWFVVLNALKWASEGASVATVCLAFFYLVLNDWVAREFTPRGRAAIAALTTLAGAVIGSFLALPNGITFRDYLLTRSIAAEIIEPVLIGGAVGALIGGVIGVAAVKIVHRVREQRQGENDSNGSSWLVLDYLIRAVVAAATGALAGWVVGSLFHLAQVLIAAGFLAALVDAFRISENRWWALAGAIVGLADRGRIGLITGGVAGWVVGAIYNFCWCFGFVAIQSFVTPEARWGAAIGATAAATLALLSRRLEWRIRRGFWNLWGWGKFFFARPLKITLPRLKRDDIRTEALSKVIRGIPITGIQIASSIPRDEKWQPRSIMERLAYRIQVWLYRAFSPMQPGLPSIDSDPQKALDHAYWGLRRKKFDPPDLPPEYEGSPDLGSLAVRGPYSIYLTKVSDGEYEWNFKNLEGYGHHKGLYNLGAMVLFRVDSHSRRLREYEITTSDLGKSHPTDSNWQLAKRLALCAATNHMSLVRHFNWVHLASGAQLAIATRNSFSGDEPLCRLLWPHILRTQQSNDVVTRGQMVRGGDFETIFSFRHDGMCRLFEDTYQQFDFLVNDPLKDAERRGVRANNLGFSTPTQTNLEEIFDVLHRHVKRYLLIYYRSDGTIQGEESLNLPARGNRLLSQDPWVAKWLKDLNRLIPNGIPVKDDHVTTENLARLIACFIYLVTVQHEMLGTFLWNYQLWTHRQPVRLYRNGRREPLDVYQRLINANFILNVERTPLVKDYSYLALDEPGRDAFRQFERELCELDQRMKGDPWAVWKIYPKMLEVNINA